MAQLTIPDEVTAATYTVVATQTVFPFSFAVFSKADLHFSVGGIELQQSDFTLSGTLLSGGGYQGGTVTLNVGVSATSCVLWRETGKSRTTNFTPASSVSVRDIDTALNRAMSISQDIVRDEALAVRVPAGGTASMLLPNATGRANSILAFDGNGAAVVVPAIGSVQASPPLLLSTIPALRLLAALSRGAGVCFVAGFRSVADGGEGSFAYDSTDATTADNGGTVIVDAGGGRWKRERGRTMVLPQWFGAYGDGVHIDTAPIRSASSFAQGSKASVYFPAGTYLLDATVNITAAVTWQAAPGGVFFTWTSQTLQAVIVNTTQPCAFTGLNFTGVGTGGGASAGAAITVTAPGAGVGALNFQSIFRDCQFINQYLGIDFVNAAYWVHDSCVHNQYVFAGLRVQCLNQVDAGDSCISNSLFDGLNAASDGIIYTSSGGLKIANSKFVTGNVGIAVSLANAASGTGDLIMIGGSIEGFATAIQFSRAAGSETFSHITLTGIQIGLCGSGISVATPAVFANLSITGCDIAINSGTGACVSLVGVSNFTVAANSLFANAGGAAGSGIVIDNQCANGKVGVNAYNGLAVTLSNSSATTSYDRDVQIATGTINATAAAYGSLFSSSGLVVVFPTPFTVAPTAADINVSATSATGAPVGFLVEGVGKNGFTLVAITAQNSGAVTFAYSAGGII